METKGRKSGYSIRRWRLSFGVVGLLTVLIGSLVVITQRTPAHAQAGDWPTYQGSIGRFGFNGSETIINPTSAPKLKLQWSYQAGGRISSQPVEANGLIYWGSWDGYEHATTPSGSQVWSTFLGQTTDLTCDPPSAGVASTAIVASTTINGTITSVVLVGGGNATFYALNAASGAIIWQTPLGTPPNQFIWSSPAALNGSVYIGESSFGDCPLVQGQVFQLSETKGTVLHTFNVVPAGCVGGGVWGSPTIDTGNGMMYFATGNDGPCSSSETMANALVEVNIADLSYVTSWQVPLAQRISDGDFGSTPTLFNPTINGVLNHWIGLANKNGIYYAFDRTNVGVGPVWTFQLDVNPSDVNSSISSSAWDGIRLYVAGANTIINGVNCAGSLRALKPGTGAILWQACLNVYVLGPVTAVPGLVVVGSGPSLIVVNAATGSQLFSYQDPNSASHFIGASISNGMLYAGNLDNMFYAFSPS